MSTNIEHTLEVAIGSVLFNAMNYPEAVQAHILGQNTRPLNDKLTAALAPVIRRIQAEALRDAADWKRERNLGNCVWGDYLLELAHEKYQAGGDDMITIWLNDRADRIEKGE